MGYPFRLAYGNPYTIITVAIAASFPALMASICLNLLEILACRWDVRSCQVMSGFGGVFGSAVDWQRMSENVMLRAFFGRHWPWDQARTRQRNHRPESELHRMARFKPLRGHWRETLVGQPALFPRRDRRVQNDEARHERPAP